MIAFITVRSSLVPLIEGLCAQIYLLTLRNFTCCQWKSQSWLNQFLSLGPGG